MSTQLESTALSLETNIRQTLCLNREQRQTSSFSWITKLDKHFERQGLSNVSANVKRASPVLAFFAHDVSIMVVDEAVSMYAKRPGFEQSKIDHIRGLIEDAKRQKQQGVIWDCPRHQVIGQKPL